MAFSKFISKRDVPAPGAGLKTELRGLADVPRLREADRKTGGNQQQNSNISIVPDRRQKPKKKAASLSVQIVDSREFINPQTPAIRQGRDCDGRLETRR